MLNDTTAVISTHTFCPLKHALFSHAIRRRITSVADMISIQSSRSGGRCVPSGGRPWWCTQSENWEGRSPTSLSRSSRLPRVNVLVIHEELLPVWPVRVFSSFIFFSFLHFPTLTNFLFSPLLLSSLLSSLPYFLRSSFLPFLYTSSAVILSNLLRR
jgi:hypothetical protein